jgi:hypothetical protein
MGVFRYLFDESSPGNFRLFAKAGCEADSEIWFPEQPSGHKLDARGS